VLFLFISKLHQQTEFGQSHCYSAAIRGKRVCNADEVIGDDVVDAEAENLQRGENKDSATQVFFCLHILRMCFILC